MEKQIILHAFHKLHHIEEGIYGCDLHNELFNQDYFIIGYAKAEQFLAECEEGTFGAIRKIKDYELDNFGEIYTDLSNSEKVANMYAYIRGEELLIDIKILQEKWDERLTQEDIYTIIEEFK